MNTTSDGAQYVVKSYDGKNWFQISLNQCIKETEINDWYPTDIVRYLIENYSIVTTPFAQYKKGD